MRTRYIRAIDQLMTLGATDVVVEEFEVSLELFAKALDSYEIPINRIWREVESVRTEHYGLLRGTAAPDLRLDTLKHLGIHDALELIEVESGAQAIGANAATLDLRKKTGAVQIAVLRDGQPIYQPGTGLPIPSLRHGRAGRRPGQSKRRDDPLSGQATSPENL